MRTPFLLFGVGLLLWVGARQLQAQSKLGVLGRFGPDGLPFTADDPLAVGGFAEDYRFVTFAGDACSEETSESYSAHNHGGGKHPDKVLTGTEGLEAAKKHVPRPSPGDYLDPTGLVLTKPFDVTAWMGALNLADASIVRWRFFPEDTGDFNFVQGETNHDERGWGTGDPQGWNSEQASDLNKVWRQGERALNLHIEGAGLRYRDVKKGNGDPMTPSPDNSYAIAVKDSTMKAHFTKFPTSKVQKLDMMAQQAYLEAWVLELTNLDNYESAISGSFVADVGGLQISLVVNFFNDAQVLIQRILNAVKDKAKEKLPWPFDSVVSGIIQAFGDGVKAKYQGCYLGYHEQYLELGGPAIPRSHPAWNLPSPSDKYPNYGTALSQIQPTDYIVDFRLEDLMDWVVGSKDQTTVDPDCTQRHRESMDTMAGAEDMAGLIGIDMESIRKEQTRGLVKKKMREKLDDLPIDEIASDLFFNEVDHKVIVESSGLVGGQDGTDGKNPYDRVALGILQYAGQFKQSKWMPWRYVGDVPVALDLDLSSLKDDMQSSSDLFQDPATKGWRYNSGSTYITRSAMMFGNNNAQNLLDRSKKPPGSVNDMNYLFPMTDAEYKKVPDVLDHFAKEWLYAQMDTIDPFLNEPQYRTAETVSMDVLFPKTDGAIPTLQFDWPPPNFNGGRAQINSYYAAAGGKVLPGEAGVDPENSGVKHKGFISIDPGSKSYSVAYAIFGYDASGLDDAIGYESTYGSPSTLGWTEPRPLPANFNLNSNDSQLRWLTATSNRVFEADTDLVWMWDFESDGTIDSEHAQHMSDLGSDAWPTLFGYQSGGAVTGGGRAGFRLVPPSTEALQTEIDEWDSLAGR